MSDLFVYPIFDDIVFSKKVIMALYFKDGKYILKSFVRFKSDSYLHRINKSDKKFLETLVNPKGNIYVFNKKNLFKIYDPTSLSGIYDLMNSVWILDHNNAFNYTKKQLEDYHNLFIEEHRKIFEKAINLPYKKHPEFIDDLLFAQSILDGEYNGFIKYFDNLTRGGRHRDIYSNSTALSEHQRQPNQPNCYYIDMKGCHFRIIDFFVGNIIPKGIHPVDYILQNSKRENKELEKKRLFTTLYSEKFDYPHIFISKIRRKHKKISSIFERDVPFNWKIQEYESWLCSILIIKLFKRGYNILTYHFDGLIFSSQDKINKNISLPIYQEFSFKKLS